MITEEQRKARLAGIGASEAMALLGLDDRMSVYDLWLIKTGRVEQPDISDNMAVKVGTLIESGVLDLAEDYLGEKIIRDPDTMISGHFRSHPDGLLASDLTPVEAKAGWHGGSSAWGKDGDSKVPDRVLIQVHVQMLCANADKGWAARLHGEPHGGLGFTMHPITADPELTALLVERSEWFWRYVETDTEPPRDLVSSSDVLDNYLANMEVESGLECRLDDDLVSRYADARRREAEAKELIKKLKPRILLEMGDATRSVAGGHKVSKYMQTRPSLDRKALTEDHPEVGELMKKYTRPGVPSPVLRITPIKQEDGDGAE